jgi:hypothetical protein
MTDQLKLLVTLNDVGVLVDVDEENASAAIATARAFLNRIAPIPKTSRVRPSESSVAKKKPMSLSERILALGGAFFSEPKGTVEISKELARSAFHYDPVRVSDEVRRLVQREQLRRIGEGTKASPYLYVIR